MALRILVVDDEQSLRETIAYNLEHQGFLVDSVGDGKSAIEIAHRNKPDLIILDIMLPGMDGFEVCRELRRDMNIPILILSARDDEYDRIVGLEIGADDYISKPFSMRELVARVKAHLRTIELLRENHSPTTNSQTKQQEAVSGNLTIKLPRREVLLNGSLLDLRPKEYDLLVYFTQNSGRLLTREDLIKMVWEWEFNGKNRTVDVHVRWLREKIEVDPNHPVRIVTVHGAGYRFEG
ncbi:MAG: response regulator transcription factor [Anaerolineaceae bacterium]